MILKVLEYCMYYLKQEILLEIILSLSNIQYGKMEDLEALGNLN